MPRYEAETQLYHSRMPQAGLMATLQGPEEEWEDIRFQRGFPLPSHLKEEFCFGFSPAQ